jgi:predicted unusual protein kinase regulating ubiquinone biosynthesis (AarF/ABC1/UbiB family)
VAWTLVRHAGPALVGWLRRDARGPERLKRLLEGLGGTFIKLGQVLALQPDIVPRRYCDALFDLMDRVPPFLYADVERTFVEDLGKRPDQVFEHFEPVPFAAASIGQVHRAVHDGRPMAVKVRRPEAEREFEADLRMLGLVASLLVTLRLRRLDWVVHMIDELSAWTREELDYRFEARFMGALARHARDNPGEAVPEAVLHLTTRRILTASYLDGPTVLDHIRTLAPGGANPTVAARLEAGGGFDPEVLAQNIVGNFVRDAFRHGLFHADLHPANLLILPRSVVGYVDFGITGSLSAHSRRNIVSLTLALTRGDCEAMLEHFLRLATLEDWSDVRAFEDGLRELVGQWFEEEGDQRRLVTSFTTVMLDILHLCRRTAVWTAPDTIRYMRSVITADGLIARFAPHFDVGHHLEEVCVGQLRRDLQQSWLSPPAVLDWATTAARLLVRFPSSLGRPGEHGARGEATEGGTEGSAARRALQLAVLGSTAWLLAGLGAPPALGLNLFTALLVLGGASGFAFVLTLHRSA